MTSLFFKTIKISVGGTSMENCVSVFLQVEDANYKLSKLVEKIDELREEWGYRNVLIVPFNHLSENSQTADLATCHKAWFEILLSFRSDSTVHVLPYAAKDYLVCMSVSGDDGSVRNARFSNKIGRGAGIKFLVLNVNYIVLKVISPATKPEGIVPQPLRSTEPHVLDELESMSKCLLLFFQVEEGCHEDEIERLHQKVTDLSEKHKKKNLFISAFGHLTVRGTSWQHSKEMFTKVVRRFEKNPELTVKHSHFGYNKEFAFRGTCIGSGRFARQPVFAENR